MIITHGETKTSARPEPSVGSEHHDRRRFERVLLGEDELAPVESAFVGRVLRSFDDVVPFEEVGFQGCCVDVRVGHWALLDCLEFSREATVAHITRHCLW